MASSKSPMAEAGMLGMTPIGAARTRSAYELTARCTTRPGPARSGTVASSSLLIAVHTLDRERFWRVWVSAMRRMQHAERLTAPPLLCARLKSAAGVQYTPDPDSKQRTISQCAGLSGGAAPQVSGSLNPPPFGVSCIVGVGRLTLARKQRHAKAACRASAPRQHAEPCQAHTIIKARPSNINPRHWSYTLFSKFTPAFGMVKGCANFETAAPIGQQ